MRRALALALLGAMGCPSEKPAAPAEAPTGLRVPLPDGWRFSASADVLAVGPRGRVVLQLERSARPLPTLDALAARVAAEGVEILQKESIDSFVGVRYSIAVDKARQEGFLGARQVGPHTVWCATTGGALPGEVEQSMTVCRSLTWDEKREEKP